MRKKKKEKRITSKSASKTTATALPAEYQSAFQRAVQFHRAGDFVQAEKLYQAILRDFPGHADSWHLMGVMASALGKDAIAVELITKAIALSPRIAEYFYNLGLAYYKQESLQESVEAFQKAIRFKPGYAEAYENLGVAYQDAGKKEQAQKAYQQAIRLKPDSHIALKNMGTVLYQNNETSNSLIFFEKALATSPADAELHLKRFSALIRSGQFDLGWNEYEWRFNSLSYRKYNSIAAKGIPRSDGSDLSGQRVLVIAEQGIGDEVMFATLFPKIIQEALECFIECDKRLIPLYQRSFPQAKGIMRSGCASVDGADTLIYAGSFLSFKKPFQDGVGNKEAVLVADNERRNYWQSVLSNLDEKSLNIGITWRGGIDQRAIKARSSELKDFKSLISSSNANFINLQYGDHSAEIEEFNKVCNNPLISFEELDAFHDIDNLCALIAELDLVISVDNATVHFAGALGKSVWILLPQGNEWRWLENRNDTLWYPNARLFRSQQPASKGWGAVLAQVHKELEHFSKVEGEEFVTRKANEQTDFAPLNPSVENNQKTILLLNDTSNWYHWGCSCTSIGVYDQCRDRGYLVEGLPIHLTNQLTALPTTIEDFDSDEVFQKFQKTYPELIERLNKHNDIVINGEGTIHSQGAAPVGLLYLAYICKKRLAKKVFIINHSCYPDDVRDYSESSSTRLYSKVYKVLDGIAVREPISHQLLSKMGVNSELAFDCLPLFIQKYFNSSSIDPDSRTIVVCGSVAWGAEGIRKVADYINLMHQQDFQIKVLVGAAAYMASDDVEFVRLLQFHARDHYQLVYARSEQEWLRTIASARLLVSGRFHHSIAAAFLGTPFLVAQSNTPKILGLLESLDIKAPLFNINEITAEALQQKTEESLASPEAYLITQESRELLLSRGMLNFQYLD